MISEHGTSFNQVLLKAFGVEVRGTRVPIVYQEVLEVVTEYNESAPVNTLSPTIKPKRFSFPAGQEDQAVELLKQNSDRFEPILPFRITTDEMGMLREGQSEMVERAILRMSNMGLRLTEATGLSREQSHDLIEPVINDPLVWEALLSSEPPVDSRSRFRGIFKNHLYDQIIGPDSKREAVLSHESRALRSLEGSPLHQFFLDNPPGSPLAERLLASISRRRREAFIGHFFEGQSYTDQNVKRRHYSNARKKMEEVLKKPVEEWAADPVAAIERLISENPAFVVECERRFKGTSATYFNLRYKQGLYIKEIAAKLGKTEGGVEWIGNFFRKRALRLAFTKGYLRREDFRV